MRTVMVEVVVRCSHHQIAGLVQVVEQVLVQKFIAHVAVQMT